MRLAFAAFVGVSCAQRAAPTEVQASIDARQNLIAMCPEVSAQCGVPTQLIAGPQELASALDCVLRVDLSRIPRSPCYDTLRAFLVNHQVPVPNVQNQPRQVPSTLVRTHNDNDDDDDDDYEPQKYGKRSKPWERQTDSKRDDNKDNKSSKPWKHEDDDEDYKLPKKDGKHSKPWEHGGEGDDEDYKHSKKTGKHAEKDSKHSKHGDDEDDDEDYKHQGKAGKSSKSRGKGKDDPKGPKGKDGPKERSKPWEQEDKFPNPWDRKEKDNKRIDEPSRDRNSRNSDGKDSREFARPSSSSTPKKNFQEDDSNSHPGPFFMSHSSKRSYHSNDNDDDDDDDSHPGPFFMSHSSKRSYHSERNNERPSFSLWDRSGTRDDRPSRFSRSQNRMTGSSFSKWHRGGDDRSGFRSTYDKYDMDAQRPAYPLFMWRHGDDRRSNSLMFQKRFDSYDDMHSPFSRDRNQFSSMSQYRPVFGSSFNQQTSSPMFLQSMQQQAMQQQAMQQMQQQWMQQQAMQQMQQQAMQQQAMQQQAMRGMPVPQVSRPPSLNLGEVIQALLARSSAQANATPTSNVEIAFKGPLNVPFPENSSEEATQEVPPEEETVDPQVEIAAPSNSKQVNPRDQVSYRSAP